MVFHSGHAVIFADVCYYKTLKANRLDHFPASVSIGKKLVGVAARSEVLLGLNGSLCDFAAAMETEQFVSLLFVVLICTEGKKGIN